MENSQRHFDRTFQLVFVIAFLVVCNIRVYSQNSSEIDLFRESIYNKNNSDGSSWMAVDSTSKLLRMLEPDEQIRLNVVDKNVDFARLEYRTEQFKIVDGYGNEILKDRTKIFHSFDKNKQSESLSFLMSYENGSVFYEEVDELNHLIKIEKESDDTYRMSKTKFVKKNSPNAHWCANDSNHFFGKNEIIDFKNNDKSDLSGSCVPISFELSYDLYSKLGSARNVTNYFYLVMNHVVKAFRKHDINLAVAKLTIHTSPESDRFRNRSQINNQFLSDYIVSKGGISIPSNTDQINQFINPSWLINRAIGLHHYVTSRELTTDVLGIASESVEYEFFGCAGFLDCWYIERDHDYALGFSNGMAISNVEPLNGIVSDGNRYLDFHSDNMTQHISSAHIIAHELGHNFGAVHNFESGPSQPLRPNECTIMNYYSSNCNSMNMVSEAFGESRGKFMYQSYIEFVKSRSSDNFQGWCSYYHIEEPADESPPIYTNNCSDINLGSGFVGSYYQDNIGHSSSNFSNQCSLDFHEDMWFNRIPEYDNVYLAFSDVYGGPINVQILQGDCNTTAVESIYCGQVEEGDTIKLYGLEVGVPLRVRSSHRLRNNAIVFGFDLGYIGGIPVASNDICTNAQQLEVSESCQFKRNFTRGLSLSNDAPLSQCLFPLPTFVQEGDPLYDQWFTFNVPESGNFNFQISQTQIRNFTPPFDLSFTNWPGIIEVYKGSCNDLNFVQCSQYDFDLGDIYESNRGLRPDIEVLNQSPGDQIFLRLVLFWSGERVISGINLICLEDGNYFPENDLLENSEIVSVGALGASCVLIDGSAERARGEITKLVSDEEIDKITSGRHIDADKDVWYSIVVEDFDRVKVSLDHPYPYTDIETHRFEIFYYLKDQYSGDIRLVNQITGGYYVDGRIEGEITKRRAHFRSGDELLIQVRYVSYALPELRYSNAGDFTLCIENVSWCPDEVFVSEVVSSSENYSAVNSIASKSQVLFGDISYKAEESVELQQEFEINRPASLEIEIEDCPYNNYGLSCEDAVNINKTYETYAYEKISGETDDNWYTLETDGREGWVIVSSCNQETDTYLFLYDITDKESFCQLDFDSWDYFDDDDDDDLFPQCSLRGSYLMIPVTQERTFLIRWNAKYSREAFDFSAYFICKYPEDCPLF